MITQNTLQLQPLSEQEQSFPQLCIVAMSCATIFFFENGHRFSCRIERVSVCIRSKTLPLVGWKITNRPQMSPTINLANCVPYLQVMLLFDSFFYRKLVCVEPRSQNNCAMLNRLLRQCHVFRRSSWSIIKHKSRTLGCYCQRARIFQMMVLTNRQ